MIEFSRAVLPADDGDAVSTDITVCPSLFPEGIHCFELNCPGSKTKTKLLQVPE
jgi:hypothetical protein